MRESIVQKVILFIKSNVVAPCVALQFLIHLRPVPPQFHLDARGAKRRHFVKTIAFK